ncbi:MAG TPA: HAMP domain-containing sensor histidine kinase [Nocardioidaceae bacterium]|nr:HAMP domain-containing sensor histidine kinase [Nocardioidaceae bacterium]
MGLTGFRSRVVGLTTLVSVLVVSASVVLTQLLMARATDADARALAHTRAHAVAATVTLRSGQVRAIEGPPDTLDAVAWVYADGRLVDGRVPTELADPAARLAAGGQERFSMVGDNLLYALPVDVQAHRVVAVVTVSLTPYEQSERRGLWISLALGLLAVILAAVVAHVVVRHSLRVIHRMSALADDWGEHDPDRRFGLGPPRDEFGELAQTLDRMLDRVAAAMADERRLTDEIAHELATPMTVLRGEAQLAQLDDSRLEPGLVLVELDRLEAAVTAILDAARSNLRGEGWCHLAPALQRAADERAVRVEAPSELEVAVPGDLVIALLTPLLDNAFRHARGDVALVAEPSGDAVVVHVMDDGPGFAMADVDRAFEPGTTSGDGHGLGLAVVRRIVDAAPGVAVRVVPDGRGHVEIRLPLRTTP